jgi:hypothetical protein
MMLVLLCIKIREETESINHSDSVPLKNRKFFGGIFIRKIIN